MKDSLGSIPGGTPYLLFPLLFQRSLETNSTDYISLDDSIGLEGALPIELPLLLYCSDSYKFTTNTRQLLLIYHHIYI